MHSILLPYSGTEEEAGVVRLAALLASRVAGRADALFLSKTLHALPGRKLEEFYNIQATEGGAAADRFLEDLYRSQYTARAVGARQAYEKLLDGIDARDRFTWQEQPDVFQDAEMLLQRAAFLHDLTLCSFALTSPLLDAVIEDVLLVTGRPVLFAAKPVDSTADLTAVIAWKAVSPTIRAMTAALPLLRTATKCHVVGIDEGERSNGPTAAEIATYLATSGIKAEARTLTAGQQSPQATLETFCEQVRADVLVMGAYSQSRLKQFIFGGFTKHFLTSRSCNVLMTA
ncbi:MAG TPA: universal stress protein [Hyphomicrobiaceae bacterium]|nr:universal stress protein [Hyphomicrobiaceae bacterium]